MAVFILVHLLEILTFTVFGVIFGLVEGLIYGYLFVVMHSLYAKFKEESKRGPDEQ